MYFWIAQEVLEGVLIAFCGAIASERQKEKGKALTSKNRTTITILKPKRKLVLHLRTRENNNLWSLLLLAWSKLIDLWKINWNEINISKSCNHWMQSVSIHWIKKHFRPMSLLVGWSRCLLPTPRNLSGDCTIFDFKLSPSCLSPAKFAFISAW